MMTADPTDIDQIMPMFMPALIRWKSFEVHVVTSDWHGSTCEQIVSIGLLTWAYGSMSTVLLQNLLRFRHSLDPNCRLLPSLSHFQLGVALFKLHRCRWWSLQVLSVAFFQALLFSSQFCLSHYSVAVSFPCCSLLHWRNFVAFSPLQQSISWFAPFYRSC